MAEIYMIAVTLFSLAIAGLKLGLQALAAFAVLPVAWVPDRHVRFACFLCAAAVIWKIVEMHSSVWNLLRGWPVFNTSYLVVSALLITGWSIAGYRLFREGEML